MRTLVALLVFILGSQTCSAWWEAGHQIITLLAYDLLDEAEQTHLLAILKDHPRLAEDFVAPKTERRFTPDEHNRWLVGRAGYWPDVARSQPEYSRPSWHYQLGSTLTIGKVPHVPKTPGPIPADATLQTQELHIAQAIALCRSVLHDQTRSRSDRALAICWLAHLVGDSHQPCHAGSLYVSKVFPEGDRGANSIPTKQTKNLHALWDSLLGDQYDPGDIRRRCNVIRSDTVHWQQAQAAAHEPEGMNPLTWLAESAECGRSHVYTPEILAAVDAVARGLTRKIEVIELSDEYLQAAGELSRVRAAFAAHRLALILKKDLK
ncbi:MAG: S1/P1 nuclease [Planctomycetes bacterium]|nr:S1/P1 nuclease [Planctomycetota bacterium]